MLWTSILERCDFRTGRGARRPTPWTGRPSSSRSPCRRLTAPADGKWATSLVTDGTAEQMELEEALVAAGAERVNVPSLLAPEEQSNEKIAFGTDESGSPAEREMCPTPWPSDAHALPVRHAERSPPRPSTGVPVAPPMGVPPAPAWLRGWRCVPLFGLRSGGGLSDSAGKLRSPPCRLGGATDAKQGPTVTRGGTALCQQRSSVRGCHGRGWSLGAAGHPRV